MCVIPWPHVVASNQKVLEKQSLVALVDFWVNVRISFSVAGSERAVCCGVSNL